MIRYRAGVFLPAVLEHVRWSDSAHFLGSKTRIIVWRGVLYALECSVAFHQAWIRIHTFNYLNTMQ